MAVDTDLWIARMQGEVLKRFTLGITTHNEEATILSLLDSLMQLSTSEIDIILYDDCSTDNMKSLVEAHPISRRANFKSHFSDTNYGTPSPGRTYIGRNALTEYVILIDGDDFIDIEALRHFMAQAPYGYDLILAPYKVRTRLIPIVGCNKGPLSINSATVARLLSGIGGRAYRTALLAEFGPDEIKGRSDDVRLNMRILLSGSRDIYYIPDAVFYVIEKSRKSRFAKNILVEELYKRVEDYIILQGRYNIDDYYLWSLKKNLTGVVRADIELQRAEKNALLASLDKIFSFQVKRIVFLVADISAIGGIPNRIKKVLACSDEEQVEFLAISRHNANGYRHCRSFTDADLGDDLIEMCRHWNQSDTVFVTANNVLKIFPKPFQRVVSKFPLIYMCSGQLSFFVQDSTILSDCEYVNEFKASAIISLSDMDINFQKQLGIHGQRKGFLPVEVRAENDYSTSKNVFPGYVGRVDFAAKGCDRLIEVAEAFRENGLPPIQFFTTAAKNPPDYLAFRQMIVDRGLENQFEFTLECSDHQQIFRQISVLLLPSRKESFGNVILEANSYGIPVISTSHAPGPAELIDHSETGYLVDRFSGEELVAIFEKLTPIELNRLSQAAFEKHKRYSMKNHFSLLEEISNDVLNKFVGKNEMSVFPSLKMVQPQWRPATVSPSNASRRSQELSHKLQSYDDWSVKLLTQINQIKKKITAI